MAQLIVTVNRLNKRKVIPASLPDKDSIAGEVLKGFTFDGEEVTGVPLPTPEKWYKDRDGYFYWGGALAVQQSVGGNNEQAGNYPDWMSHLNIPKIWSHYTGKNVGVAVIDTGIDTQNPQLLYDKNNFYIFDSNASLQDTNVHGTHCAALIGARNLQGKMVGAAPGCKLFVCKISEKGSLKESELKRYADAINWCAGQKDIHVISISWGSFINDQNKVAEIQAAVDNAIQKNKVLVCAIGDASQFNDPGPLYPASLEHTIAIGSIPVENVLYPYINKSLTTITVGLNIPSFGLNNTIISLSGTSQSNAIVAGITALIIEKKNLNYTPSEIKNILLGVSTLQKFNGIIIPVINGDLLLNYFQL